MVDIMVRVGVMKQLALNQARKNMVRIQFLLVIALLGCSGGKLTPQQYFDEKLMNLGHASHDRRLDLSRLTNFPWTEVCQITPYTLDFDRLSKKYPFFEKEISRGGAFFRASEGYGLLFISAQNQGIQFIDALKFDTDRERMKKEDRAELNDLLKDSPPGACWEQNNVVAQIMGSAADANKSYLLLVNAGS